MFFIESKDTHFFIYAIIFFHHIIFLTFLSKHHNTLPSDHTLLILFSYPSHTLSVPAPSVHRLFTGCLTV